MPILGKFVFALLLIFSFVLQLGCQKEVNSKETIIKETNPNNQPTQGPIDGVGGCNGPNGKCLERFAVRITDQNEFQSLVRRVLENLAATMPEVAGEIYSAAWTKSWYLIPVDLRQIPSQRLGLYFLTDQNALQSLREIWIDKRKYDLMSEDDKATLILHELVMALKILTQLNKFEQCIGLTYQFDLLKKPIDARDARGECRKANPPIPGLQPDTKVSLNKDDYVHIRRFTTELMFQKGNLDADEWLDWLERTNLRPKKIRNQTNQ
jgi:hypothetical protein